ncbi:MAG: phosphotransferase family protein, partial [Caulobacterales bacterium]
PNVESMLSSIIQAGKSGVERLGADSIQRFLEAQPNVTGDVEILNMAHIGDVGASSGLVLFTARYETTSGPATRDLVLRHAPGSETRIYFEYDLSRQFRVQRALQGSAAPVPEPLWLDPDGRWLGVPGYVMARAQGAAPHPSAFTRGPIAEAPESERPAMLRQIMDALVAIHKTDIQGAGLNDFVMNAPGGDPMERCINWYWRTWEWIKPSNYQDLVKPHQWLLQRKPSGPVELMHGDSTLHNYMFFNRTLTAVVDWEMSSLGHAEADLALQCVGNAMFAPPPDSGLQGPPSEAEWLELYYASGGRKMREFEYYKKFAAFMVVTAITSIQRNMTDEVRASQSSFLTPLWDLLRDI